MDDRRSGVWTRDPQGAQVLHHVWMEDQQQYPKKWCQNVSQQNGGTKIL